VSDDDLDQLRLSLFFVPLPEPVPIPHGTTISFALEEQDSRLRGISWQPAIDVPPIPDWDGDHLFVSVKFWQVKAVSDYYIRQVEAVFKVISAMKGVHSRSAQPPNLPRSPSQS
jgi:hypothetical protein